MEPSTTPSQAELLAEIERVRETARFRKAPVLRDLLSYLAHHAAESPNEYTIGVEVLGRRTDFDPKTDASVRVHMGRLRQRLKDYYDNEGSASDKRIVIPAGSYQPVIEKVEPKPQPVAPLSLNPKRWIIPAVIAALAVAVAALAFDNWRLRTAVPPEKSAAPLHSFWTGIARPGESVNLVVPAPVFYQWPRMVARDFFANTPAEMTQSPILRELRQKLGEPEVSQIYTVASDTLAAATLSRYLGNRGVAVEVRDTPTVTLDLFQSRNAVLLVGPGSVAQVADLLEGMSFYLKSGSGGVLNRKPRPGEPDRWQGTTLAPLRTIGYGIVARIPGKDRDSSVLVLASTQNTALAGFLTTAAELDRFESAHAANGKPRYFEAVVEYERNNDRILRAKAIAFRAYDPASK